MASTLDISNLWTRIEIDTDVAMNDLDAISSIREQLGRQLTLGVLTERGMVHFLPAGKLPVTMLDNELIERVRDFIFGAFDSACVEHLLSRLKIRIGPDEIVR
jgi:hypothetical protein